VCPELLSSKGSLHSDVLKKREKDQRRDEQNKNIRMNDKGEEQ